MEEFFHTGPVRVELDLAKLIHEDGVKNRRSRLRYLRQ